MRFLLVTILFLGLTAAPADAAPHGKGKGSAKGKGHGHGKAKKNRFARGEAMHNAATESIAKTIAAETGLAEENYTVYSSNLADTLGQLSEDQLIRIFGDKLASLN